MLRKVRIKSVPQARTGYQVNGSLANDVPAFGGADYNAYIGQPNAKVSKTLTAVPREEANLEAEGGETVVGNLDGSMMPSFKTISGPRHTEGGVPLNLPDDSFIFSDTKDMKINDPNILKMFGKPATKGGYTPADLSKQYDIQKYRDILQNPNTDKIDRKTAELMIKNYTIKLGALALAQESKKAFPQGIPEIARPYMEANGINDQDLLPQQNPQEEMMEYGSQQNPQEEMNEVPTEMPNGEPIAMSPEMMQGLSMAMYGAEMGGFYPEYAFGGELYKAQDGAETSINPYKGGSRTTPTGKSNAFNRKEGVKDYLKLWENIIPGISTKMSERKAQEAIYDWSLENNPEAIKNMWQEFGLTEKGKNNKELLKLSKDKSGILDQEVLNNPETLKALKDAYVDGMFGGRQIDPVIKEIIPEKPIEKEEVTKQEETIQDPGNCICYTAQGTTYNPGINPDGTCKPCNTFDKVDSVSFKGQTKKPAKAWLQDKIDAAAAFGDWATLKKYMPWQPNVDLEEMRPTFVDPTRELAAQSEQANLASQMLSQFAGPQALNARLSQIQGQGARSAADTLSRYNNQNVGTANQFEANNVGIRNQERQMNNQLMTSLYDKNTIANQQFDNAKRAARANMRDVYKNMLTNKWKTDALNQMYPNYHTDPSVGGRVLYIPTEKTVNPENETLDKIDYRTELKKAGWSEKEIIAEMNRVYGNQSKSSNFKKGGFTYSVFPIVSL